MCCGCLVKTRFQWHELHSDVVDCLFYMHSKSVGILYLSNISIIQKELTQHAYKLFMPSYITLAHLHFQDVGDGAFDCRPQCECELVSSCLKGFMTVAAEEVNDVRVCCSPTSLTSKLPLDSDSTQCVSQCHFQHLQEQHFNSQSPPSACTGCLTLNYLHLQQLFGNKLRSTNSMFEVK